MLRLLCLTASFCGLVHGVMEADELAKSEQVSQAENGPPTDAAVRLAVSRSLPFLEKVGVEWMDERDCLSCHHVPFMLWAHRAAHSRGFAVDAKKLANWDEWARADSLGRRTTFKLQKSELEKLDASALPVAVNEKLKPIVDQSFATEATFVEQLTPLLTDDERTKYQALLVRTAMLPLYSSERSGGGLDVLGQLLLGRHDVPDDPTSSEFRDGVIDMVKRMQLADGSWTPGSQFATMRRWSRPAADQATTMWATLALATYDAAGADRSQQIERALAYVQQQPPQPDNHEWLAIRLLFERKFGGENDVARFRKQLVDARNADGGWSWNQGGPSDPFTTGLVTYVLAKVGSNDVPVVLQDARNYLLTMQQPDGSWLTPSRNISDTTVPERPEARDEIYHYWGTAWCAIGLLETLKAPKPIRFLRE